MLIKIKDGSKLEKRIREMAARRDMLPEALVKEVIEVWIAEQPEYSIKQFIQDELHEIELMVDREKLFEREERRK